MPFGKAPWALPHRALVETTGIIDGDGDGDGDVGESAGLLLDAEGSGDAFVMEHFPNRGLHPFPQ
jgi:hypothetical protein